MEKSLHRGWLLARVAPMSCSFYRAQHSLLKMRRSCDATSYVLFCGTSNLSLLATEYSYEYVVAGGYEYGGRSATTELDRTPKKKKKAKARRKRSEPLVTWIRFTSIFHVESKYLSRLFVLMGAAPLFQVPLVPFSKTKQKSKNHGALVL